MSRGRNELIAKFKMAAGDVIRIREQVMEYMFIPTGIKREIWCRRGMLEEDRWAFILVDRLFLVSSL